MRADRLEVELVLVEIEQGTVARCSLVMGNLSICLQEKFSRLSGEA